MNILLINGSPNEFGNTYKELCRVKEEFKRQGVESDILYLGAAPIADEIAVTIERCDDREISGVLLASPEWEAEKRVPFTDDGKHISFTIPAASFSGYLLAVCE